MRCWNYLAKQTRAETPGQARTQIPYLAVVHRLDQPVEGVLVFAKNKDAAGKLGRQVKDGTMKKEYLAVCEGKIEKQGVQKFEDFLCKRRTEQHIPRRTARHRRAKKSGAEI